jgi:uncharacterized protein (DUF983 family)
MMVFSVGLLLGLNVTVWTCRGAVRVFQRDDTFKQMQRSRNVWWVEMLVLGSVLVMLTLSTLAAVLGVYISVVWLREKEDGVKKQVCNRS